MNRSTRANSLETALYQVSHVTSCRRVRANGAGKRATPSPQPPPPWGDAARPGTMASGRGGGARLSLMPLDVMRESGANPLHVAGAVNLANTPGGLAMSRAAFSRLGWPHAPEFCLPCFRFFETKSQVLVQFFCEGHHGTVKGGWPGKSAFLRGNWHHCRALVSLEATLPSPPALCYVVPGKFANERDTCEILCSQPTEF